MGNKQALEYIYRRYAKDLFNYGMKIKTHRNLVKDCIQELFVELWKSRSDLSETHHIKFYLLKAIKIKIYHQLKKQMRFDYISSADQMCSDLMDISSSYEAHLIEVQSQEESRKKVTQCVQQLPARQREIIHLLFFEGQSYEEIADIMGIHVQSVYTLAWKALSALKKRLVDFPVLFLLICLC
jgi:RNA polymerase sigma factor (sigma-70 family)